MRSTLIVAALAGMTTAQSLSDVLNANNQTSQVATLISSSPELSSALGNATNITILAPSNDALTTLSNSSAAASLADPSFVSALLTYHVIQGNFTAEEILNSSKPLFVHTLLQPANYTNVTGGQYLEVVPSGQNVTFVSGLGKTSNVVQADISFTGGTVHIIDSVLTLPENISTTAVAANLTALAGALTSADLVDALDTLTDVTVFAPNNQAFSNIGSALPNLTTEQLTGILTYHVVNSSVIFSTDLSNGTQVTTLNGANLTITSEGDSFFVNGAEIIRPDVLVENGVVHVIDNVLNPANATAAPSASATAGVPAFDGASSASDIAVTSGVATPTTSFGNGATTTAGGAEASGSGTAASGSSSSAGAAPMRTAFPVVGALIAGAAILI